MQRVSDEKSYGAMCGCAFLENKRNPVSTPGDPNMQVFLVASLQTNLRKGTLKKSHTHTHTTTALTFFVVLVETPVPLSAIRLQQCFPIGPVTARGSQNWLLTPSA